MGEKFLSSRMQNKCDTTANWAKATNFVPKSGEIIIYSDGGGVGRPKLKVGDGSTLVGNLKFCDADRATKLETTRTIGVSGAATGTAQSFDGSSNITIPITGFSGSYLTWGGRDLNGDVSPIDAAMSYLHSANRAQFANPAGITIEYSTDGGTTWADYGASDAQKVALVSGIGANFYIGKKTSNITTSDQLRITVNAFQCGFYTRLKTVLINFSSSGATNSHVLIERSTIGTPTTFVNIGTYGISGWSGWNSYPLDLGTLGGGASQTTNNAALRFTLSIGGINSAYSSAACICDMMFLGVTYWQSPSPMAKTGHLYSWDYQQNAAFPANITTSKTISSGYLTATASVTTPQITISNAAGLKYTGIDTGTSNVARKIWFADASSDGIPVVSANFKYNPSTNVLTVGSITGKAGTAGTADKVANSLSINGKTFNGSSAVNVGTIGIAYGGTGATTVAQARTNLGLDSVAKIYDTVAEMKTAASTFTKGDIIETNGYYTSGDGGGAQYIIWQGTVETTDTAFSIQLTSTLAASVIRNGNNFNVLQYGVKNDGVTDVTDMVNTIFSQVPHDSTIYFPAGEYKFTGPIIPNRLAAIKGDTSTIFKDNTWISSNTSGTIFDFDVSLMPNFDDQAESALGTTITYNNKTYKLDHDGFTFLDYGLTGTGRMGVNIENIFFNCNSYDVALDVSKYASDPDQVFVETITKPKINCIKMGANFTLQNCTFDGWSGYALTGWDQWNEDGYPSWSAWNHVDRCYFVHCKQGILSAIDSQFMNLRFNECYTGIVDNGSANMFLNIRMDSIGMYGIKMEGNQCEASTIIGLDVDVGYGPGLVVHGSHHYIQGHIGRCGGKSSGKAQSAITYDDFPYSCNLLLDDAGALSCNDNKIDVILSYGVVYEYADAETQQTIQCPAVLVGATNGEYSNIGLDITSSRTADNTDVLFTNVLMAQSAALNAPSSAGTAMFKGNLTINGETYCIEEKTAYPFDRNNVSLNNFFLGFNRDAATRLPTRLGTMMEHYWNDRYCLSVWDAQNSKYEWIDIKNPAIDTTLHGDNATASAKETGTELGILRQRVGNLESALAASNITNVSYPSVWQSVGSSSRSEFMTEFSNLDLNNNEIEIKVDFTNLTSSNKPSDGSSFIRFVDGTEENLWNNTGWTLSYNGLNSFQSFISNLDRGTQIWSDAIAQDWSKKFTIRINRQGMLINNVPVQAIAANKQVYYRDAMQNLINDMVAAGSYKLYISGNQYVIIDSIKLINYNMTDTTLVANVETIPVNDLRTYLGL